MTDLREQIKEEVAAALGDAWLSSQPAMDRSSLLPMCPTASNAEDISRALLDLQAERRAERIAGVGWRSTEADVGAAARAAPETASKPAAPSLREQIVATCADAERPLTSHEIAERIGATQKRISVDLPGLVKKGLLETFADAKPRTWYAPGKLYKARTEAPLRKSTTPVHTKPEPAKAPAAADALLPGEQWGQRHPDNPLEDWKAAPAEMPAYMLAPGSSEIPCHQGDPTVDDPREVLAIPSRFERDRWEVNLARANEAAQQTNRALLALTRSAQAAQHALEEYLGSLNDPVLQHLLKSADHAERARERLTNGNAQEA